MIGSEERIAGNPDFRRISFRDPSGSLTQVSGRIIRVINENGARELGSFLETPLAESLFVSRTLVGTRILDASQCDDLLSSAQLHNLCEHLGGVQFCEHERIDFPTYPYEWSPAMLHEAATLTLDLCDKLLPNGFWLKDATPMNVLFQGSRPVFVDLLSIERREPGDPTWVPEAQFVRTFLLPLAAYARFGISLAQSLPVRGDGITPEEMYRWLSFWQRLSAPFRSLVTIPVWLASRRSIDSGEIYRKQLLQDGAKAAYVLEMVYRRLRKALAQCKPPEPDSNWSGYMTTHTYSNSQFQQKEEFFDRVLSEFPRKRVLDLGCNTGYFSVMAARSGASVVAADSDPAVVDQVWRHARTGGLDILPMVVDLARPTPSTGWANRERISFLDRAEGKFDLVVMLALIHHLLVTERIPLGDILAVAARLTNDLLVIEYVGVEDPMFKRIARGRDHLHADDTPERFEAECRRHFEIVRKAKIESSHRILYLLRKREPR